jgi:hypothetical protein
MLTKSQEQKEKEAEMKKKGKQTSVTAFHFDLDSLTEESVHEEVKKIADDEITVETKSQKRVQRKTARDVHLMKELMKVQEQFNIDIDVHAKVAKSYGGSPVAGVDVVDDESSVGESSLGESSVGAASVDESLDGQSLASMDSYGSYNTFESGSQFTLGSQVSSASVVLGQIRKARGQQELADKEMESLVMLLGNGTTTLASIKQRHFEERMFKNLYKERTHSLSNDYYLPGAVLDVLHREEMLKNIPKPKDPREHEAEGRRARKREKTRREKARRGGGRGGGSVKSTPRQTPREELKTPREVMIELQEAQKSARDEMRRTEDSDYEDEDERIFPSRHEVPEEIKFD